MDHDNPSLLPKNNTNILPAKQESPRKPITGVNSSGGDRLKRDEWSEGAVSSLLEAYETKWVLRNRAKLKGHDWEDVASYVSSRANSTKSPKTQTQCKNKIESMKKRYRSESAAADGSSWPLYSRLDLLLRGTRPVPVQPPQDTPVPPLPQSGATPSSNQPLIVLEPTPTASRPLPPPLLTAPPPLLNAQISNGSNGVDKLTKDDGLEAKSSEHVSNKNDPLETDSSTPALYSNKEFRCNKRNMKMENNDNKRRKKEELDIAESIRWLAELVVKSEQARMDTMKEIERMRVEAETKRGEMDLKRTEIIANTQLEIARILASVNKGVDSSLRMGRST
ncbi:Trihelix transcription factor [Quillaja saponaria]|uniref:Trihelix transcription factor n=1 Tax=Quillaja saponaria TaxID=32244 RepID=A0AAD7L0J4_QUISA|nr:Trihelix transcription factor [Quillaja saponaria]